jgi:tRNA 2-thiouridine synthesizing protein C
VSKNILFVTQQAPCGSVFSQEKLQMAMVFGAFELNVSMLFMKDGVFALLKNQDSRAIGMQNFSRQYHSLAQYYDIREIYVDRFSMEQRALTPDDLLISVRLINRDEMKALLQNQDAIINN